MKSSFCFFYTFGQQFENLSTKHINDKWLKAAVIGSYWGTLEIVLGSFFHNMRFPMSGTILSFFSVVLLVSFSRLWRENGLFWRASLIAALMKSISPSAVILGPMTGIMLEGFIMESFVFLFGKNIAGYIAGGAMAVFSALLHKLITLLVLYGYNLVRLLVYLYQYALEKLNISESGQDAWLIVALFVSIYLAIGSLAAFIGYYIGNRAEQLKKNNTLSLSGPPTTVFSFSSGYSIAWLLLHLALLSALLWVTGHLPLGYAALLVFSYVAVCIIRYKQAVRHLKKPFFWIQLVVITLLASLVWNGFKSGTLFNREGLITGLQMNLRAILVMVSFSAISVELRNPLVRVVLFKRGFARLYLSLNLAFSSMPLLMEAFARPREIMRKPVSVITRTLALAESLLESFAESMDRQPLIYLVTGAVGAGKTAWLKKLVAELKKTGLKPSGLLAEGILENGQKKGYRLVSVTDGASKPFGFAGKKKGKISTGRFTFYPDAIHWGEDVLWRSLSDNPDVMIVDEVGSLELKGQGWAHAIAALLKESSVPQVWAVRSRLVDAVQAAWNFRAAGILEAGKDTPRDLVQKLKNHSSDPHQQEPRLR